LTPKGKVDPWGENYIDMCPSIILKSWVCSPRGSDWRGDRSTLGA
jgi:hypothetical protein